MSSPNLPKMVLRSPGINDTSEDSTVSALRRVSKFHEVLRTSGVLAVNEMHQNRMKNLRKELDALKETEWKYHPLDKYIGQSF